MRDVTGIFSINSSLMTRVSAGAFVSRFSLRVLQRCIGSLLAGCNVYEIRLSLFVVYFECGESYYVFIRCERGCIKQCQCCLLVHDAVYATEMDFTFVSPCQTKR